MIVDERADVANPLIWRSWCGVIALLDNGAIVCLVLMDNAFAGRGKTVGMDSLFW